MSSYSATYDRQAIPENWKTISFTVRRPGNACWEEGLSTYQMAQASQTRANSVAAGHRIYAEQEYVGELPSLTGQTRTVER